MQIVCQAFIGKESHCNFEKMCRDLLQMSFFSTHFLDKYLFRFGSFFAFPKKVKIAKGEVMDQLLEMIQGMLMLPDPGTDYEIACRITDDLSTNDQRKFRGRGEPFSINATSACFLTSQQDAQFFTTAFELVKEVRRYQLSEPEIIYCTDELN